MVKFYTALIIIGILSAMGYSGYAYYTSTQAALAQLRENAVKMEIANKSMQETLDNMKANQERNEALNKQLTQKLQFAESKLDKLRSRFSQIDITAEARKDPNGLAERVNKAVDRLRKELNDETNKPTDNSSNTTN
jgi:Tfp pilus assembly protein PilE